MEQDFFFKGNRLLKNRRAVCEYDEEQIRELAKCYNDIIYFMTNYIYIISLDKGKILFEPYDYQQNILKTCKDNRFCIFTLGRQLGKTITICAYLLYEAIFNPNMTIAILANNATKSREILGRIRMMYEELPYWMKPGIVEWNKGSIEFSNGSKIFSGPTTSSSLRGYSINILYLDEFAFVQNDVEFYTSSYPVIVSGTTTKIIITSTPNGMNLFYKLWTDSVNGNNLFHHLLYTWNVHPLRDEKWKIETIKNTSQKQFDQEHECRFLGSSNTLISGDALEKLIFKEPIRSNENYNLYRYPEKDHVYVGCVDVSEGIGKDYSTLVIVDITKDPYEQVYVYRNNSISPWDYSVLIHSIVTQYNNAYLIVENNAIGKIVADDMIFTHEYENMISSKLNKHSDEVVSIYNIGVKMTKKTKAVGCSALKSLIENNILILNDWTTIQELSSFVKVNNSYEAEKNKHDDTITPLIQFSWLTTQEYFKDLTVSGIRELLVEKRKDTEEMSHAIFGFYDDGIPEEPHFEVF